MNALLRKRNGNDHGFTLVELMIVVAIIGVLAALAIYGVRKYLTNAKSAEARMAVGRLAKDAQLAFEKETVTTGVIPLTTAAAIAHKLCSTAAPVPALLAQVANVKYQSSPADWKTADLPSGLAAGWNCLKFTMSDPQYYQYEYVLTGDPDLPAAVGDTYTATAHGDLDGDGTESRLSMDGAIQAAGGELVLTLAATITEFQIEE